MDFETPSCSKAENDEISNDITFSNKPVYDDVIIISSSEEESDNDDIILIDTIEEEETTPLRFEPRFEQYDLPLENGFDDNFLDYDENEIKKEKKIKKKKVVKKNQIVDTNKAKLQTNSQVRQTVAYYEIKELDKFFRRMNYPNYSECFKTGQFSWRIKAFPIYSKDRETRNLAFHIQCINDEKEYNPRTGKVKKWSCYADVRLILVNQINGGKDREFVFSLGFSKKVNTFGPVEYITKEKLLNVSEGYYKDDKIKLKAEIKLRDTNSIII